MTGISDILDILAQISAMAAPTVFFIVATIYLITRMRRDK